MKTTELKGYGITGIKVELNLMDRYEASHMLSQINALQQEYQENGGYFSCNSTTTILNTIDMVGAFLSKIAMKPSEESSIFTPIGVEDLPVEDKEC